MYYFIFLSLLLSFSACKNRNIRDNNKNIGSSVGLINSSWYFTKIVGPGKKLTELKAYKISFGTSNYSLKLDLNTCNGSYSLKDNTIKFSEDLTCTKICCDDMHAENLKGLLNSSYSIEKIGDELIIKNDNISLHLSSQEPTKGHLLKGKQYLISKFGTDGKDFKPKFGYLVRFEENAMSLKLSVNSCGSDCSISDKEIDFSQGFFCTEMCCDSDESIKIRNLFKGKMQYSLDGEMLTIYDGSSSISLIQQKETIIEPKSVKAADIIGKNYKIVDLEQLPEGPEALDSVSIKYSFDYIVSFRADGLGLKLDVNNCNSSGTYSGSSIEIGSGMGCTKMCCDSRESSEVKNYFKGRFELKIVGDILIMSNQKLNIRLEELK